MRTLYFDIDGTILPSSRSRVKRALAGGSLERALREAGFGSLVCVGNFAGLAHMARALDAEYDALGILLRICDGAFRDETWFRSVTALIKDPARRGEAIDLDRDWWYVDDLASEYLVAVDRQELVDSPRVLVPDPEGDGAEILEWIGTAGSPPGAV